MLALARQLFADLKTSGIRHCHWKSNVRLEMSLSGQTDLDILVARTHLCNAQEVLARLGFRLAVVTNGVSFPSMLHYYGLEEETASILHVHVYTDLITGESLLKNYRLPLTDMLFSNLRLVSGVPVPTKAAELIIFALRVMLKHAVWTEQALLHREGYDELANELEWLLDEPNEVEQVNELLARWLPGLDPRLFWRSIEALSARGGSVKRWRLGVEIRCSLASYRRYPLLAGIVRNHVRLLRMAWQHLAVRQPNHALANGGLVVAFVGPDGSGKSTLICELQRWLGRLLAVRVVHAGKPPASMLTAIPRLLLPLFRRAFPRQRSTNVEMQLGCGSASTTARLPMPYLIRAVWLGHERKRVLVAAYAAAARGAIVLCDRYPSSERGFVDSAQIPLQPDQHAGSMRQGLAALEDAMYKAIPAPHLVFRLSVPVNVAVQRSALRSKPEREDMVRYRHSQPSDAPFGGARLYHIDTNKPLEETLLEVKRILWRAL